MSQPVQDDWVLDEAEGLLDMDGRGSAWTRLLPTCKAVRSSRSTRPPRATGSSSASKTAAPGNVARQPRRLTWEPRALDALEQLAEYMPAAARDALDAMERMASTGFNYGRLTSKGILWYFPTPKLGLFYLDDGRTLTVVDVVDARRLRRLP